MRRGTSRREWLAGALAALGGLFCRPRRMWATHAPARPPVPPCCPPCGPAATVYCTETTYTYDAEGSLVAVSGPVSRVAPGAPCFSFDGTTLTYCYDAEHPPEDRPLTHPTGIDPDEDNPTRPGD